MVKANTRGNKTRGYSGNRHALLEKLLAKDKKLQDKRESDTGSLVGSLVTVEVGQQHQFSRNRNKVTTSLLAARLAMACEENDACSLVSEPVTDEDKNNLDPQAQPSSWWNPSTHITSAYVGGGYGVFR